MFNFTRYQLIGASVIVGLTLVGMGLLAARSGVFSSAGGGDIKFSESKAGRASPEAPASDVSEPGKLTVHVAGKVSKPGVYEMDPGSRVKDAIEAAGNALPNADLDSLNLAEKLADGQQIYIAARGKVPAPRTSVVRGGEKPQTPAKQTGEANAKSGPQKLTRPGEGAVNINTADLDELQRLPGIGPAMAQRILDYRAEKGRFQSVDELDEVKGIGPAKLEKMRPFVAL